MAPESSAMNSKACQNDQSATGQLHVLVAEDDPINSSIVKKRLEKLGYSVRMTSNGKECASVYRDSPDSFEAVLMDLQVIHAYLHLSFCVSTDTNTLQLYRCPSSTG